MKKKYYVLSDRINFYCLIGLSQLIFEIKPNLLLKLIVHIIKHV